MKISWYLLLFGYITELMVISCTIVEGKSEPDNLRDYYKPDKSISITYIDTASFSLDSTAYIVSTDLDLNGKTIYLPQNCSIDFNKGSFSNGKIIGDSTIIIYRGSRIFENVEISGTWIAPCISTDMFAPEERRTLEYISILSANDIYNTICINRDCIAPIKAWDSYFKIKSYTHLIINADIYADFTSFKGGYVMAIDGNNISINGNNHYLYGDINRQSSNRFEWLHGLVVYDNCRNVLIENIKAYYFCGDGFGNRGSDIIYRNIAAEYNGRQGLSITKGNNIIVENSTFKNTGRLGTCNSGGPGAGIDIEPNKGDKVNNITIQNCVLSDNHIYMENFTNDLQVYNTFNSDISIVNCSIGGLYFGKCSEVEVINCSGIKTVYGIDKKVRKISLWQSGEPYLSKYIMQKVKIK